MVCQYRFTVLILGLVSLVCYHAQGCTSTALQLHYITRNILDCDQSNYSSRIFLAHIPAKLLS